MPYFRSEYDRRVDAAHSRIASEEMRVSHSFTPEAEAESLRMLAEAQAELTAAVLARQAFHDRVAQETDD
jgi:hypothetical protein